MSSTPAKILCLGRDEMLLECRRAVLAHAGYEAFAATFPDGYKQLSTGEFDLVIMSARLAAEQDGDFSSSVPPKTQTLLLNGFIFPTEMLAAVADLLQCDQHRLAVENR